VAPQLRVAAWLGVAALAALAHWYDNDALRGACALSALAIVGLFAPRSVRLAFAVLVAAALAALIVAGVPGLLDALPALIAAFVGWLFARTLRRGRTPLIARAIRVLDGDAALADPAIAAYARMLTIIWAVYQIALALCGAMLALHVHALPAWLPGPRVFGAVVLPTAVVTLFLGEFALRRRLLPQAPRHALPNFAHALVRAWPQLLDERQ
jgi:uncharacterized membrane protein